MKNFKKSIALLVAVSMIVGCVIGGALAWLTSTSGNVVNTFTTSDINITLAETKGGTNKEFKMIPGWTIDKDPKVTVVAGSEDCYLFVKIEKSNNFDTFLTCEVDVTEGNWTRLSTDKEGNTISDLIYYRTVTTEQMGTEYSVLKDNKVTVRDTVTKEMMNSFDTDNNGELSDAEKADLPKLTVTAYASQLYKNNNETFTAAEAWANAQPSTGGTSATV